MTRVLQQRTEAKARKRSGVVTWRDHTFPALRLMRGEKTAAVARKTGLSWGTINRMRKLETTHPRFETISKIVTAYGGKITITYE